PILDQMSMMKEPINRRRSHGLGHQLVESRRMEIRRNRDGSLLISSIDKPIQTFGSIITDRQQPDVVNDHEIGSQQPLNSLRHLVIRTMSTNESAQIFQLQPGHASTAVDRKSTRLNYSHVSISYAV